MSAAGEPIDEAMARPKIIRVRLVDKPSGEFRVASVAAHSREEAVEIVERQEQKRTAYALTPEMFLELERRHKEAALRGSERGRLFTHMQDRPYVVARVER